MNGAKAISLAPEKCNPTRKVAASYTQEELFVLVGKVIFWSSVMLKPIAGSNSSPQPR